MLASRMPEPFRIIVLISGRGSNFEAIARAIDENTWPIQIAAVISDKRSAKGLAIAEERGIPTEIVPRKAKQRSNEEFNTALVEVAKKYSPQLVVLAGFMRVLTTEFITEFPNCTVNIHPSLLPLFRGLHPQQQALDAGATESGVTVHYINEEIDAGAIIAQATVPVLPDDTEESLSARILTKEHKLYPAVIYAIASGNIELKDGKVVYQIAGQTCSIKEFLRSLEPGA